MKSNQTYTPKYWVAHDTRNEDVFIETLAKSKEESIQNVKELLGSQKYRQLVNEGSLKIDLIELKLTGVV